MELRLFNGITDRVGQLMSFLLHARHQERETLFVEDFADQYCNGSITKFLEVPDGVELVKKGSLKKPITRPHLQATTYGRCASYRQAADELRLRPKWIDRVEEMKDKIGGEFVTMHSRRTDKVSTGHKVRSLQSYINSMNGSSLKIYLATDDPKVQEALKAHFGDRLFFYTEMEERKSLRNTSLEHAFIDLAMCLEAKRFEGDPNSGWYSFARRYRTSQATLTSSRTVPHEDRGAISYSLYGTNPLFVEGIMENIPLAEKYYPGWDVVVHVEKGHPAIPRYIEAGAKVVEHHRAPGRGGEFWRFETADDTSYPVMVVRDADSRIGPRERRAVEEWLASGRDMHIMRDHDYHYNRPVVGCAFGLKTGRLPMKQLIEKWQPSGAYCDDEHFLGKVVAAKLTHSRLIHQSAKRNDWHHQFPTSEQEVGFVGQRVQPSGGTFVIPTRYKSMGKGEMTDFYDLYKGIADKLPNDSGVFVELGVFEGHSLCYMAEYLTCSGKTEGFEVFGYDTFEDMPKWNIDQRLWTRKTPPEDRADILREEISKVSEVELHIEVMCSWEAAAMHEEESVDAVFIDACHKTEAVMRDILAWWPKIKPGGVLTGHDITLDTVHKAVNLSGLRWRKISRSSWIVEKPVDPRTTLGPLLGIDT